jgi:exonuclease SbcC
LAALTSDLKNQTKIASTSAAKAKLNLGDAKLIIAEDRIGSSLNALSEVSKLIGKLDDAEKNVASALSKFQQATANSEKVLKESGFKSILIALESVLEDSQVASLKKVIKDADERLTTITGLKGRIEDKKVPTVRPDIDAAEEALAQAKASAELAFKLSNGINQAINIVAALITAQATDGVRAKAELEFAKETLDIADKFKNGTNGRNGILGLERWVQRHLFREVCNVGNTHIRTLSKGRYELTLESQVGRERARAGGLDLYVMDAYNGKTRPVQSLSGGETFLVSLALALSLAEVVQSNRGGIELTSLFIDEGFGTLDGDTLESAVSLLESIRSDGRSIGVITHVDQMQKTLPIGMKIHKTARGSSVEQMDALSVVG